ncbi:MAG: hypothetical protein K2X87_18020 [Gemmataceae bacterium]|nr:hypothetical protein [Gemmataceae bacterium]
MRDYTPKTVQKKDVNPGNPKKPTTAQDLKTLNKKTGVTDPAKKAAAIKSSGGLGPTDTSTQWMIWAAGNGSGQSKGRQDAAQKVLDGQPLNDGDIALLKDMRDDKSLNWNMRSAAAQALAEDRNQKQNNEAMNSLANALANLGGGGGGGVLPAGGLFPPGGFQPGGFQPGDNTTIISGGGGPGVFPLAGGGGGFVPLSGGAILPAGPDMVAPVVPTLFIPSQPLAGPIDPGVITPGVPGLALGVGQNVAPPAGGGAAATGADTSLVGLGTAATDVGAWQDTRYSGSATRPARP